MSKVWKNAVVGCGVVGEWHVRVLEQIRKTSGVAGLVGVCDVDVERAKAVLAKHGAEHVPVYADQRELLEKCDAEVIHVATPSGNHADPAILAMQAGRQVICEKPIEIELPEIDRMINAAGKHNVKLAGIFQNRWNPANRALKDAADAGRFGQITFAGAFTPWYRTDQYYRDGGWRGTWAMDGGGAMMNQSVHNVDLIQWIAGPVKQVSAFASALIHPEIEVEDTLVSNVIFENGAYGHIMGATSMWPGGHVRIEIGGSKGTAVSEDGLKRFDFDVDADAKARDRALQESINGGKSKTTGGGSSATDVSQDLHQQNIEHILAQWEKGEEADTNGVEARKAVAIILALYESAKKGGAVVKVG